MGRIITASEQYASDLLCSVIEGFEERLQDDDEHLADTAKRFSTMLKDLTNREKEEFNFTTFENTDKVDEMVIIEKIPFYTLCAHHIIPFFGYAHIAYIPDKTLAGLSKFARTVKYWAKGIWAQEELTVCIADFLEDKLEPHGVAVVMKAEHLCMTMRGVQVPGALTTTSAMRGAFADHTKLARNEFLALVGSK